jgi:hypothetical protein
MRPTAIALRPAALTSLRPTATPRSARSPKNNSLSDLNECRTHNDRHRPAPPRLSQLPPAAGHARLPPPPPRL